ncbi:hypothetical protein [[Flexibacter] sp. ATCC 35208]|uniref:hypothetical protein n=1 Tax=[Flexibacter] sp. ATCC 35208 TaxID=1936242 RepID=UPI0009C90EEB|nr:hypothetical protein [[Flexibacter] sp. ATCC 35208]OMP74585.1 hypothetical protein BW716_34580 [[Flexibacter] sp. ATCC 35208]
MVLKGLLIINYIKILTNTPGKGAIDVPTGSTFTTFNKNNKERGIQSGDAKSIKYNGKEYFSSWGKMNIEGYFDDEGVKFDFIATNSWIPSLRH